MSHARSSRFPPDFSAILERAVDALPIDPNFIPEPERSTRVASLRDEILQLERIEEGLCEATSAVRRSDASPEAVLGLRLVEPTEPKERLSLDACSSFSLQSVD